MVQHTKRNETVRGGAELTASNHTYHDSQGGGVFIFRITFLVLKLSEKHNWHPSLCIESYFYF